MKKIAYIAGGILIGFVFSTTTGAFADQIKSLVGKKVTGEYTVIVDGKSLSDKGAIIDSKANVPVRALSQALGADVQVSGKTITITSTDSDTSGSGTTVSSSNTYSGKSKEYLESMKSEYNNKILPPLLEGRDKVAAALEEVKSTGNKDSIAQAEQRLAEYQKLVDDAQVELKLIDEALAAIK
ncbi:MULTISPECIES: stalk domain-containing protein [unclassified Paenibacillus]|uniref:stalk domain-containing protein n=1 Tax=unclassified Paenibacillus TaxID=185978 RepID=UPI0030ED5E87